MEDRKTSQGFTLIELSIVLVIIGLIVGGVLVGRDLVKAAEHGKVIAEVTRFRTAVNTFKGKYGSLPGDIPDATTYLPTCVTDPADASNRCNGNADGQVSNGDSCGGGSSSEALRLWQHLALASMLEGNYTGYTSPAAANLYSDPGVNEPRSVIGATAHYRVFNASCFSGFTVAVELAGVSPGGDATVGLMSPADAYSIDRKMDDGLAGSNESTPVFPWTGNVIVRSWNSPTLALCSDPTTTPPSYNLASTQKNCALDIRLW